MNARVKKMWIEGILDQEKYPHGKRKLRQQNKGEKASFCWLGVLCEIALQNGVVEDVFFAVNPQKQQNSICFYDGQDIILPAHVQEWAHSPLVKIGERVLAISDWNDLTNINAVEIAQAIDEQF